MCQVARNQEEPHRQTKKQAWQVTATAGKTVYLKFDDNVFRKHFLLVSKKSKSSAEKAENKARKRFLTTKQSFDEGLIEKKAQGLLQKRYGIGGSSTGVVDLSVLDLKTVLAQMGQTLLDAKLPGGQEATVRFAFTKPCVLQSDMTVDDEEPQRVKVTHQPLTSGISFNVEPATNGTTFTIGHCLGCG